MFLCARRKILSTSTEHFTLHLVAQEAPSPASRHSSVNMDGAASDQVVEVELQSPTDSTRLVNVLSVAAADGVEPAAAASRIALEESGAPQGASAFLSSQFFSTVERERSRSKTKKKLAAGTVHKPTVRFPWPITRVFD